MPILLSIFHHRISNALGLGYFRHVYGVYVHILLNNVSAETIIFDAACCDVTDILTLSMVINAIYQTVSRADIPRDLSTLWLKIHGQMVLDRRQTAAIIIRRTTHGATAADAQCMTMTTMMQQQYMSHNVSPL